PPVPPAPARTPRGHPERAHYRLPRMRPRREHQRHRCRPRRPMLVGRPGRHPAPQSGTVSRAFAYAIARDSSDVEGFTAAATPLLVRIAEGEAILQLLFDVIHFGPEDEHDRFRIDQDRHAFVFDDLIVFALFAGVFE